MTLREKIKSGIMILDGGMGTRLQAKGLSLGELPEIINLTHPKTVQLVHKDYICAGAEIIYTNTLGANTYKLKNSGYTVSEVIHAAICNVRTAIEEAGQGSKVYTALDIGSLGKLMQPFGELSQEEAYRAFQEQILAGSDADCIVIETMTDLLEMKTAVLAAKENSTLPIIATMSFEANERTFTGCTASAFALTISGLGVDAIGVNCSVGPKQLNGVVREIKQCTSLPIVIKPNAGLPDPETGLFRLTAEEFAADMVELINQKNGLYGGCCGTTPEHIKMLKQNITMINHRDLYLREDGNKNESQKKTFICSGSQLVSMEVPRIIGERINPTGKKKIKEALLDGRLDVLLSEACAQEGAGAELLDVNVGLPGIDEKEVMTNLVLQLQGITGLPLQIDSTNPEVIEAALRVYRGKAIVNSVNGEEEVCDRILPIIKKYGAAVVGLTLNQNGIPKTAEGRLQIAEKILRKTEEYGIPREDVIIDCLTLTVSAEPEGAVETLKALKLVKDRLQVKTVLGVSNISFGLPNRELINSNFLMMALQQGLDFMIINPLTESMMGAVRSYRLLSGQDKNAEVFLRAYAGQTGTAGNNIQDNGKENARTNEKTLLNKAVRQGLGSEAARLTKKLLETKEAMEIVDTILIPALDEIGAGFERGELFLPQLMSAATASQSCFEVIKVSLQAKGKVSEKKGKIVLATVKGDIHDIGKNIVKVLLDNYGFEVIDLGRDVAPERIVDEVVRTKAALIGLSALMTTTVKSMEVTIQLLREKVPECRIMVGGAVLTNDYAMKIGADYYCKDAKEAADRAREVYS